MQGATSRALSWRNVSPRVMGWFSLVLFLVVGAAFTVGMALGLALGAARLGPKSFIHIEDTRTVWVHELQLQQPFNISKWMNAYSIPSKDEAALMSSIVEASITTVSGSHAVLMLG